jgi:hypothetical protein
MIEMTSSGQAKLDDYLQRFRFAVRGLAPAEREDLEQSVREHVEAALASASAPVGAEQVAGVLDRLGAPDRWVPQQNQPLWKTVMERLRTGPEDWRLAYVAFGAFALGLLTLPIGIGVFILILSFFASRAYVEFMRNKGESLDARRWLVYPPIGFFLLLSVIGMIIGPAGPLVAWGIGDHEFHRLLELDAGTRSSLRHTQFDIGSAALIFGSWWVLASLVVAILLPVARFIFQPLLSGLQRKHVLVLALIGLLVALAGGALLAPFFEPIW